MCFLKQGRNISENLKKEVNFNYVNDSTKWQGDRNSLRASGLDIVMAVKYCLGFILNNKCFLSQRYAQARDPYPARPEKKIGLGRKKNLADEPTRYKSSSEADKTLATLNKYIFQENKYKCASRAYACFTTSIQEYNMSIVVIAIEFQ